MVVGLLLAAGLAVVVMTRTRSPSSPAAPQPGTGQPEIPPDVADTGIQTGNARVQFADKKDPGRAAGMIEWTKLEPISQVEKRLIEPRGYIYMRDGGVVIVSSKSGRLNTNPKVQEPQSGRFEGGVTVELFPAGFDPKSDKPTLTAKSESLDFDIPSASVSTTGAFTVRSTSFDIDGSGMRLIANQLEEGIERFEVARVTKVLIRPDAKDPITSAGLTSTQPARATPGANNAPDKLRTYRAVIDGAVRLTQGRRVMTAERAEAWAHLVNNRLPEGAIGRLGPDPALTGSCPDTEDGNTVLSAAPAADKKPVPSSQPLPIPTPASGEDTTITGSWTGRLVVTPVGETGEGAVPSEFKDNKAALRLDAGPSPVTVFDEGFKGTLSAARLDFGATTRVLTLASTPAMQVHIDTASAGSLVCKNATVDLGKGQIDLTGPGELIPAPSALAKTSLTTQGTPASPARASEKPAVPTNLTFANALTLNFRTVGNWITRDAKSASVKGGFTATSGDVKASADEATVLFRPLVKDKNTIEELLLKGNAVASAPAAARAIPGVTPAKPATSTTANRDTLKGDQMSFKFAADPATGQEIPLSVEVTGKAQATAGGTGENGLNLKARSITASLGKEKDQIVIVSAEANEEVHVSSNTDSGAPPLMASGDKLTVDPAAGVAHMFGAPVTITRDGAVMTGNKVRITQANGEVFVDGPGTVSSLKDGNADPDPAKHEEPTAAFAAWTKSMTFNNTTGKATCVGDATATMTVGETERNSAQASTIILSFTPAENPGTPKPAAGSQQPQRELISAEAVGDLGIDGKPPRPATLEHREFTAVTGGEPKLTRLVYLEGQRILAHQPSRTLDVPVPGKLLVDDRTPEPAEAPTTSSTPQPAPTLSPIGGFTSTKGTSLFSWADSLHLDLNQGRAVLKKDVALTHQPVTPTGGTPVAQTTLDCDQLTAFLKTQPQGTGTANTPAPIAKIDATLERVEARGNVVAKHNGGLLNADTVTFDTIRQIIEAAGSNDADRTLISYIDPARPAPLRARKVTWDQKNGEVRIIEPAPTNIGP